MNLAAIAVLLLAAAPAFSASSYDPDPDRAALRRAATASYDAAVRAAGLPLEPAKAADIKASLDETVAQARASSMTANSLETAASARSGEMDAALKAHPAPDAAAKDLADSASAQRARWKTLSSDHDGLQSRVSALPDPGPDGKPNRTKAELTTALRNAAGSLSAADRSLTQAEAGAAAAADAAAAMTLQRKRALGPDGERAAYDAEVERLADALPPPAAEAKGAVDQIGVEPQNVNRTRAGQKLASPRDLARQLFSAADRACNRADEFHSVSNAFDRAQAAFKAARGDGATALDAAKAPLDDADRAQAGVRDRLDHPRP